MQKFYTFTTLQLFKTREQTKRAFYPVNTRQLL
uniref:Uncharacterized protein n=1 Tax=Schistosoma curassoni TaxID=6186 RepID=A0A183JT96_9TREM